VAVWPATTVADPCAAVMLKSVPVPEKATECGLPAASSVIVTIADRAPAAVGVKVPVIVQFAPATTLVTQSFV
jgi:hypothetical protein